MARRECQKNQGRAKGHGQVVRLGAAAPIFFWDPISRARPGSTRLEQGRPRPKQDAGARGRRPQQNIYKCQEAASRAGRRLGKPQDGPALVCLNPPSPAMAASSRD